MSYIDNFSPIEGAWKGPLRNAGVPGNGTNEVQTLEITGSPTGGTYRVAFNGFHTDTIAFNATATAVQTALRALRSINGAHVTVTGTGTNIDPYVVTFVGNLAKVAVPPITLFENNLTGGTTPSVAIVEATPGVTATQRGAAHGVLLVDSTNKKAYINTGTSLEPVWTVVGAQT